MNCRRCLGSWYGCAEAAVEIHGRRHNASAQALKNMRIARIQSCSAGCPAGFKGIVPDVSYRILAAVTESPHPSVIVRDFAAPDLRPCGALLRTACSEVCGPRRCGLTTPPIDPWLS